MREWLRTTLISNPAIANIVSTRVHQSSDIEMPPPRPFMVFTLGVRRPAVIPGVSRLPFQVWSHDDPGSYLRVDQLLELLRGHFVSVPRPLSVIDIHWIEDSRDLRDDQMTTITRFSSYQFVLVGPEGGD